MFRCFFYFVLLCSAKESVQPVYGAPFHKPSTFFFSNSSSFDARMKECDVSVGVFFSHTHLCYFGFVDAVSRLLSCDGNFCQKNGEKCHVIFSHTTNYLQSTSKRMWQHMATVCLFSTRNYLQFHEFGSHQFCGTFVCSCQFQAYTHTHTLHHIVKLHGNLVDRQFSTIYANSVQVLCDNKNHTLFDDFMLNTRLQ